MAVRTLRYNSFALRNWKGATFATDRDALAFLEAAQIYDRNQQKAVVDLVRRLKTAGLWSKMKAIYPFVGGTATAHKWNLKDPQDTDAAFRLTFNGGWTHSANGVDPNGTNAYANTFLVPTSALTYTSSHVSVYVRENIYGNQRNIEIGSYVGTPNRLIGIYTNYIDNLDLDIGNFDVSRITVGNSDSRGYYIGTRTANNLLRAYRNGSTVGSNTTNDTVGLPTNAITYSAVLVGASYVQYSNKQLAFATIGDGLTDTDATNLYNIVDVYQKRLGRAV